VLRAPALGVEDVFEARPPVEELLDAGDEPLDIVETRADAEARPERAVGEVEAREQRVRAEAPGPHADAVLVREVGADESRHVPVHREGDDTDREVIDATIAMKTSGATVGSSTPM
jgi:hypothetical protein